jgi:hypothetical protein
VEPVVPNGLFGSEQFQARWGHRAPPFGQFVFRGETFEKILEARPEAFGRSALAGVADPGPALARPATTKPERASANKLKKDLTAWIRFIATGLARAREALSEKVYCGEIAASSPFLAASA